MGLPSPPPPPLPPPSQPCRRRRPHRRRPRRRRIAAAALAAALAPPPPPPPAPPSRGHLQRHARGDQPTWGRSSGSDERPQPLAHAPALSPRPPQPPPQPSIPVLRAGSRPKARRAAGLRRRGGARSPASGDYDLVSSAEGVTGGRATSAESAKEACGQCKAVCGAHRVRASTCELSRRGSCSGAMN